MQTLYTTLVGFGARHRARRRARRADRLVAARLRRGLSAADRLFEHSQGRGGADLRAVVRRRHRSGGPDRDDHVRLPDRRERRDRACHHRARARGRDAALKASKLDILFNVGLPRTMPYFFASLKVAVTLAFVGTVIAETVASNRGIGNLMMIASSSFDVPLVFAGLLDPRRAGRRPLRDLLVHRSAGDRLGAAARTNSRWAEPIASYATLPGRPGVATTQQERSMSLKRGLAALPPVCSYSRPALRRRTRPRSASRSTGSCRASTPGTIWAQEKGYFAAEKLDVTIDQGEGSAATVTRIMSGAYDAGFGDMNAIIQNAATRAGRCAGDGLHDLQPRAVRAAHQGGEPDPDVQGSGRQEARHAAGRRVVQAAAAARQEERRRLRQASISSTSRRTCRSRCCCRARSTSSRSSPRPAT